MKFISTRGICGDSVAPAYAIKTGIASDGGLFMPEDIPTLTKGELTALSKLTYAERAAYVIGKFLTDYTYEELLSDASAAYSEEKFGPCPAPVKRIDDRTYYLELWHGPTCAFKDVALQIMPRLFVRAMRKCGEDRTALILVATSGDTGKAALEGYRDVLGTKIAVFYPTDGVSQVQKLQMQTQEGSNLSVFGIEGNFDDAQNGVKRIFGDKGISTALNDLGLFTSSANSINWGRLVPQIVYYVSAYLDMLDSGDIQPGEVIDVAVPTGNFGNIFAAFIAKRMGLPLGNLICASNSNNVLTQFLATGEYDKNRKFYQTISPSMDILISSNLERLLYLVAGQKKTAEYMEKLKSDGKYRADEDTLAKIKEHFIGFYASEEDTLCEIRRIHKEKNYLIDTHTATAAFAARKYMDTYKVERKVLIASTASPYKFAKAVLSAIDVSNTANADDVEALSMLSDLTGTEIPTPLKSILNKPILHSEIIEKEAMDDTVLSYISGQ